MCAATAAAVKYVVAIANSPVPTRPAIQGCSLEIGEEAGPITQRLLDASQREVT